MNAKQLGDTPAFAAVGPNGGQPGMTLRQLYAGLAMAQHANDYCAEDAATWAVRYADALLAELAKEQEAR